MNILFRFGAILSKWIVTGLGWHLGLVGLRVLSLITISLAQTGTATKL